MCSERGTGGSNPSLSAIRRGPADGALLMAGHPMRGRVECPELVEGLLCLIPFISSNVGMGPFTSDIHTTSVNVCLTILKVSDPIMLPNVVSYGWYLFQIGVGIKYVEHEVRQDWKGHQAGSFRREAPPGLKPHICRKEFRQDQQDLQDGKRDESSVLILSIL